MNNATAEQFMLYFRPHFAYHLTDEETIDKNVLNSELITVFRKNLLRASKLGGFRTIDFKSQLEKGLTAQPGKRKFVEAKNGALWNILDYSLVIPVEAHEELLTLDLDKLEKIVLTYRQNYLMDTQLTHEQYNRLHISYWSPYAGAFINEFEADAHLVATMG